MFPPPTQLDAIVRRVMKADIDHDKRMSLDEFKLVSYWERGLGVKVPCGGPPVA